MDANYQAICFLVRFLESAAVHGCEMYADNF